MEGQRGGTPMPAMIAAPEAFAADAGADVLARGGNAVDAAVTCAFAQGVLDPHDTSVGGDVLINPPPGGARGPAPPPRPRWVRGRQPRRGVLAGACRLPGAERADRLCPLQPRGI